MIFYAFSRACKQIVLNYLTTHLTESKYWNGFEWVTIPATQIVDARSYHPRRLPAVVTDSATGSMRTISFNQNIGVWEDVNGIYGERGQVYQVQGGRSNVDVTLFCAANDRELQQQLTDLVAYYLMSGRGWLYYNRYILLGEIRFSGEGVDDSNQQEPVYYASLVVPVTADWRLLIKGEKLGRANILVDIATPSDPFMIIQPPLELIKEKLGGIEETSHELL